MASRDDDTAPPAAFGLAGGCAAVVVAALGTAAVAAPHDLAARALIMAAVAGMATAMIRSWRAAVGVTVFAGLVFVGFLAHRYGDLTGATSAWSYTILIALAAALGRAQRWMRHPARETDVASPTAEASRHLGWRTLAGHGWKR